MTTPATPRPRPLPLARPQATKRQLGRLTTPDAAAGR